MRLWQWPADSNKLNIHEKQEGIGWKTWSVYSYQRRGEKYQSMKNYSITEQPTQITEDTRPHLMRQSRR